MLNVKPSAIIYTGYEYQTMYGVLLLADWLDDPKEYCRINFEADIEDDTIPKGVDDIVCERTDGKTDYYQVKFSPSPFKEENFLNWNWLLQKSGKTNRSRSILKKLYDAILNISPNKLGQVILVTNKLPDRDVESCFDGEYINPLKISPEIRSIVEEQIGNNADIDKLFSILKFKHSYKGYESLDRTIKARLETHSNDDGIERLLSKARTWAKFKDTPTQGGWIYLHNIREILSSNRPKPIPQSFLIPKDYSLPNEEFHKKMLKNIGESKGGVFTLTGTPGRGKSTYLSYLCKELEQKKYPFIRHHYFLAISDQTLDRFNPKIVIDSLLFQINKSYYDIEKTCNIEDFRSILVTCGEQYKKDNIPFIIILDGLDHVWRDNDQDKKPLDTLFRVLFPLPENVILIIGTQPISEQMLPDILLSYCPKDNWIWLPPMSGNSILGYLKHQYESGRLHINCHESMIDEELKESAQQLTNITLGYPLHVIYSCEYLAQNGLVLSSSQIEKLPTCEGGSIEAYYEKLWQKLSNKQKDILHLCCCFLFNWPSNAFEEILNDSTQQSPSIRAVSHMLYEDRVGFKPFHESLIVFIKNTREHDERINFLIHKVCVWLERNASDYLRNCWYWSILAKLGNTAPLRDGLTRNWILDRLSEGYLPQVCIRLLTEAETISFCELQFAEAYKQRALKTRLLNGPEFQIWDLPNLECLSFLAAPADLINQRLSSARDDSTEKLATMAIALWHRNYFDESIELANRAIERHKVENKLINRQNEQHKKQEVKQVIMAGVLTDTLDFNSIFEKGYLNDWPSEFVDSFIKACCLKNNLKLLVEAHSFTNEPSTLAAIELSAIRHSILEGGDITLWVEFLNFNSHPISSCLRILKQDDIQNVSVFSPKMKFHATKQIINADISYHQWFFACLNARLAAKGNFCWLPVESMKYETNLSFCLELLEDLSCKVADKILNSKEKSINFVEACSILPELELNDIVEHEKRRAVILLKRDWLEIAADCHLLTKKEPINLNELTIVAEKEIFSIEWIRLWYIKVGQKLLSKEAANKLIVLEFDRQHREIEETINRVHGNLELAEIAFHHSLFDLFKKHLWLTWDYVLGYSHHKDLGVHDVLTAVEYLSEKLPDKSLEFLKRLSPIIFNITDFTDGDETRHTISIMNELLAKLSPTVLISKYKQEIQDCEWSYADNSLKEFLRATSYHSDILNRISLTGLSKSCLKVICEISQLGNDNASFCLSEVKKQLGYSDEFFLDEQDKTSIDKEKININPELFPPNLFNELKDKYDTKDFWFEWYQYWQSKGKEQDLINILRPYLASDNNDLSEIKYLYAPLYKSVKLYEGKSSAFLLLIAAHKVLNGWSRWYESIESKKDRLLIVAKEHADKVDEFIIKTTDKDLSVYKEDRIIPGDDLVYLLVESGRIKDALSLTESMIRTLEEETRNIRLPIPAWEWNNAEIQEKHYIHLLISRLRWPVPAVKWWVSQHLAELLISNKIVEQLLLEELSLRTQESECIEVLSVFLMSFYLGYKPSINLGDYINVRSILSDMILNEIQPTANKYGNYSTFPLQFNIKGHNNRFDYMQGNEVPLVYKSTFQGLEEKTNIPFLDAYKSEWNNTFNYSASQNGSIHYFFGTERKTSTGQFYTNNSHRGRSSYLRVLELAKRNWSMPIDYAEDLAIKALPLEPVFANLQPEKPSWIPDRQLEFNAVFINDYVQLCLKSIEEKNEGKTLGALSFSIKLDENSWIDISIVRCLQLTEKLNEFPEYSHIFNYSIADKLDRVIKSYSHTDRLNSLCNVRPLLGSAWPVTRYGHWHSDIESRGINIPLLSVNNKYVELKNKDEKLIFELDSHVLGEFGFWYNEWSSIHLNNLPSLSGTYTLLNKDSLDLWSGINDKTYPHIFMCTIKLISREENYKEFDVKEINCFIEPDT